MPIVINEFEVVAEPPPPGQATAAAQGESQGAAPSLTAHDVRQIVEQQRARELRVIAH
jgi:hypothetical protein